MFLAEAVLVNSLCPPHSTLKPLKNSARKIIYPRFLDWPLACFRDEMKKYLNMTTNSHLKCACIFFNLPVPFFPLQFLFSSRVLRNVPFGNPSKLLEDEEHQMCTVYESLSGNARVVLIVY